MSLLALCYPEISDNDYKWIQSIRSRYDKENLAKVEPHITVIFPIEDILQDKFVKHVTSVVTKIESIDFILDHFEILWDKDNSTGYLCLMPDDGRAELVSLYNMLYTGILENKKSFEEGFKPHMTVGIFNDKLECSGIVEKLNSETVSIKGKINSITIADYDGIKVTNLKQVMLGH